MLKDLLAESAKQFEKIGVQHKQNCKANGGKKTCVKCRLEKVFDAQISSAFALGEQSGWDKGFKAGEVQAYANGLEAGEQSGIKKAVEEIGKWARSRMENYNETELAYKLEMMKRPQSKLTTKK